MTTARGKRYAQSADIDRPPRHRAVERDRLGMAANPDYVVADGSSDPGPVYLGEDTTLGLLRVKSSSSS
jgi:hypothetical protein